MSKTLCAAMALAAMAGNGTLHAAELAPAHRHVAAQVQWSFGGSRTASGAPTAFSASVRLAGAGVPAPPLLAWSHRTSLPAQVHVLGVPLAPGPQAVHANGDGGNALMLPALVLAGGVAVALMVDRAGKAAERQQRD